MKPQMKAVAMAYSMARKAHAKKMGGVVKMGLSRADAIKGHSEPAGVGEIDHEMHTGNKKLGLKRSDPDYGMHGYSHGGYVEEEPESYGSGGSVEEETSDSVPYGMMDEDDSLQYPEEGDGHGAEAEALSEADSDDAGQDKDRQRFLYHFVMNRRMRRG